MRTLMLLLCLTVIASSAFAQAIQPRTYDSPLFDANRLSLAAGIQFAGYSQAGSADPLPRISKEFEGGLFAGYPFTQHVKAVGAGVYGLDSKRIRWTLGLRLQIKGGQ